MQDPLESELAGETEDGGDLSMGQCPADGETVIGIGDRCPHLRMMRSWSMTSGGRLEMLETVSWRVLEPTRQYLKMRVVIGDDVDAEPQHG